MRKWKSVKDPAERIFMYFREHADKFLTEDHVAVQVGIGKRRARRIIHELAGDAKLEAVETVSSSRWGRPKMMFRACRHMALEDTLRQRELFKPRIVGVTIHPNTDEREIQRRLDNIAP